MRRAFLFAASESQAFEKYNRLTCGQAAREVLSHALCSVSFSTAPATARHRRVKRQRLMADFKTLDDLQDVAGKRVLVRVDLNVPVKDGAVSDATRIERGAPTITELADMGA